LTEKVKNLSLFHHSTFSYICIVVFCHRPTEKWLFYQAALPITCYRVRCSNKHKNPRSFKNINCPKDASKPGFNDRATSLGLTGPRWDGESITVAHMAMQRYPR